MSDKILFYKKMARNLFPVYRLKIIKVLPFIFLLFVNAQSCKSPTGPEALQPGRRDYTWTVDTLNIPYTVLESIWGSSPTDIWAVGPGGDKDKTIYHFDGTKWNNDGISRSLAPRCVFGFAQNNVWFGGYGNNIWHYDGNSLSDFQDYTIPNYPWAGIENIWGDNPNNVYAVGVADSSNVLRGIIRNFNGTTWQTVYISNKNEDFVKILRGNLSGNNYYILSERNDDNNNTDSINIYQFNGKNLLEAFSSPAQIHLDIASISSQIFLVSNNNIYALSGHEAVFSKNLEFVSKISTNNFWGGIWGRNKDDIFLGLYDGIAHYNGSNIAYLFHFNTYQVGIGGMVLFDKEIFILCYDFTNQINFIIRGKLN